MVFCLHLIDKPQTPQQSWLTSKPLAVGFPAAGADNPTTLFVSVGHTEENSKNIFSNIYAEST